jgi:HEAT repeat protein
VGQQYVHELKFEQRIGLKQDASARPSPKESVPTLRSVLEGDLSATVVERAGDRVYVQYHLRPTSLAFESGGRNALDDSSRAAMLTSLQLPFYVHFNGQGAAVAVHMEKGVDLISQNLLRSVVASIQVVTPPEQLERWPSQELDTTGQFEASYQRLEGPRQFEKKKVRYRMMTTPEGLRPLDGDARITVSGGVSLVLDEDLWVQSLAGQDRVEVEPGKDLPAAVGEVSVSLRLREKHRVPLLAGSFTANRARLYGSELSVQTVAPQDPKAQLRRTLAGGTLTSLTRELRALARKDGEQAGPETAELMNRMHALFLLEPGAAAQVPGLIRDERSRNVYSSLIGSLSSASTPEAIHALAQVSSDKALKLPVRVDAIAGLGTAASPTSEGVEELRRLGQDADEDIRGTATLALGNSARTLLQGGDPAGDAVLRELEQLLRTESDPGRQAVLLKALANTADERALPAIEASLRSEVWVVREAAVGALRLIPNPAADRLLVERMLGDAAPQVRRGAVFASSFRNLQPLIPAMEQALRSDQEAAVRSDIVRLLGERRNREPRALELLAWVSQNDPIAELRQAAGSFLAPAAAQP